MREFSKIAGSQISAVQSTRDTVFQVNNMLAGLRRDEVKFLGKDVKDYHTVSAILRGVALLPDAKRSALVRMLLKNLECHVEERDAKEQDGEKLAAAMAAILSGQPEKSGGRPIVQGEHTQGKLGGIDRTPDKRKPKPEVRSYGE